tara:strand:- start:606 stop:893 length:288 start_codon:yes stop_codon:yes gene_type:complete
MEKIKEKIKKINNTNKKINNTIKNTKKKLKLIKITIIIVNNNCYYNKNIKCPFVPEKDTLFRTNATLVLVPQYIIHIKTLIINAVVAGNTVKKME